MILGTMDWDAVFDTIAWDIAAWDIMDIDTTAWDIMAWECHQDIATSSLGSTLDVYDTLVQRCICVCKCSTQFTQESELNEIEGMLTCNICESTIAKGFAYMPYHKISTMLEES